jgi:hypothetical protein
VLALWRWWSILFYEAFDARSGIGLHFGKRNIMSSEVPVEIEDKQTAVSIMRELVEHLQDAIEALKREIVRNPKSSEYRKALKGTSERLTIAKQILAREEARASHTSRLFTLFSLAGWDAGEKLHFSGGWAALLAV